MTPTSPVTAEDLRDTYKRLTRHVRRGKFNARRFRHADGHCFDSLMEGRRYDELKLLLAAKRITDLKVHPRYPLVVNGQKICTFIPDFTYRDVTGTLCVVDVKGVRTAVFVIKSKLFTALTGLPVVEVHA